MEVRLISGRLVCLPTHKEPVAEVLTALEVEVGTQPPGQLTATVQVSGGWDGDNVSVAFAVFVPFCSLVFGPEMLP